MSNAALQNQLGDVVRNAAMMPGIGAGDLAQITTQVEAISKKVDHTNGLDNSRLAGEFLRLNPKIRAGRVSPGRAGRGKGKDFSGALDDLANFATIVEAFLVGGRAFQEWADAIGLSQDQEQADDNDRERSRCLDELRCQTESCVESVNEIDETASIGMGTILEVLLSLIAAAGIVTFFPIGSMVIPLILAGLIYVDEIVSDRNQKVGECYKALDELCQDLGSREDPQLKEYVGPGDSGAAGGPPKDPQGTVVPTPQPEVPTTTSPRPPSEPQPAESQSAPTPPAAPPTTQSPAPTPQPVAPTPQPVAPEAAAPTAPQSAAPTPQPVAPTPQPVAPEVTAPTAPQSAAATPQPAAPVPTPQAGLSVAPPAPAATDTSSAPLQVQPEPPTPKSAHPDPFLAAPSTAAMDPATIQSPNDGVVDASAGPESAAMDAGARRNLAVNINVSFADPFEMPPLSVVPPLGPAGETIIEHFMAGIEAFKHQVEQTLPHMEVPPLETPANPFEPANLWQPGSSQVLSADLPLEQPTGEPPGPGGSGYDALATEAPAPEKPAPESASGQPVSAKPGVESAIEPASVDAEANGSSSTDQVKATPVDTDVSGQVDAQVQEDNNEQRRTRKTRTW